MQLSVNVDMRWTDTQNFTDLTKPICSGATRNNTLAPGPPGQLERESAIAIKHLSNWRV